MDDQKDRALALYNATPRDREPPRDADIQGLHDAFARGLADDRSLGPVFEEMQWLRNEVDRLTCALDAAERDLSRVAEG